MEDGKHSGDARIALRCQEWRQGDQTFPHFWRPVSLCSITLMEAIESLLAESHISDSFQCNHTGEDDCGSPGGWLLPGLVY